MPDSTNYIERRGRRERPPREDWISNLGVSRFWLILGGVVAIVLAALLSISVLNNNPSSIARNGSYSTLFSGSYEPARYQVEFPSTWTPQLRNKDNLFDRITAPEVDGVSSRLEVKVNAPAGSIPTLEESLKATLESLRAEGVTNVVSIGKRVIGETEGQGLEWRQNQANTLLYHRVYLVNRNGRAWTFHLSMSDQQAAGMLKIFDRMLDSIKFR